MGLINNIIACYILAFVVITHGALLLCVHQQQNQSEVEFQMKTQSSKGVPQDSVVYNCPNFPSQAIEFTQKWINIVPQGIQKLHHDVYRMAGTETVNFLIWLGTIALVGDAILILYYTLVKPVQILKSIVGNLVRLAIIVFVTLFVIYTLSEQGILPKYQFLENLQFLQLNNAYEVAQSSCQFFTQKFRKALKKYF